MESKDSMQYVQINESLRVAMTHMAIDHGLHLKEDQPLRLSPRDVVQDEFGNSL